MFHLPSIPTDNDAFYDGDDGATEVARILRDIADRLENGSREGKVVDSNGNGLGRWHLTTAED